MVKFLNQPSPVQKLTRLFRSELQSARFSSRQESFQNPNLKGNSAASDGVLFGAGSSQNPKPAAYDDADLSGLPGGLPLEESFFDGLELPSSEFSLLPGPPDCGISFEELMTEKDHPKTFLALVKIGKPLRAKSVRLIEVIGSIPTDPTVKQAFCRGLVYGPGFHDTGKHVLKLCTTGDGCGSLLGLQNLDLTGTYVGDLLAVERLWLLAREKSLNDFIGQVLADCAKKHGEEAAAEFLVMVADCPRQMLANFNSVELWHKLFLEDKLKEDFAKMPLCKTPEIIDPPPAASTNHPIPDLNWKPVPDLNKICVEDDAGESSVDFAIGQEKKVNSKKRKTEAAGGEGQDHAPKMPTFP